MKLRSRILRSTRLLLFLTLAAGALAAGCARPPKPKIDNLYRGLNENLPRFDPRLLAGRRVVIDPGHGGHFPGTRGPEGLDESSVNLGVALYLWGLLREAGAEAYLTRSADRDLLGGPDSTVTADLQVRVDMVESVRPDIVVSIHHNAQPQRDPAKNAVETYYKLGDPASRDLAFAVHRHLVRNLGIDEGEVRPGNYYILREVSAPAVLGEGSYLTHPTVEAKLRLSDKQRLEAEAYFLGILEYFSRGTPMVAPIIPNEAESVFVDVPILAYSVTDVGGLGIDPSGLIMELNGVPVAAALDVSGSTVGYEFPWDSPNGTYDVSLTVRNVLGNSSRQLKKRILLDLPAEHAVFTTSPRAIPRGGGVIFVRARLLDRRGLSVADGHPAAVIWSYQRSGGEWTDPERREVRVRNGVVDFFVELPAASSALRVTVEPRLSSDGRAPSEPPAEAKEFELVVHASGEETATHRSVVVLDGLSGQPVDDARLSTASGQLSFESRDGRYLFAVPRDTGAIRIHAPGYRPSSLRDEDAQSVWPDTLHLEPWYGGQLSGRRVVVSPEGETGSGNVRGPLGLSGAYASLQVARYLQEYLEAAGARVRLARWTEETPLERDIVAMTNRLGADEYIEIRYRGGLDDTTGTVRTFHFPGSARGRALADVLGEALGRAIGARVLAPIDAVTYPLQQTACPAVIVQPPSIGRIEEELRLSEPWYQREQAYGIFCGILQHCGADDTGSLHVVLASDSASPGTAQVVSDWLVDIDDTWRLLTAPDGTVRFDCLPPGRYRVTLRRSAQQIGPIEAAVPSGDVCELFVTLPLPGQQPR